MTTHLRDLDEVVRQMRARAAMDTRPTVSPIDHLLTTWANTIEQHHAAIRRDAEDAARWRFLMAENNKGPRGGFRICWPDPQRDGLITTDGVSIDGRDDAAIVRVVDAAIAEGNERG